MAQEPLTRDAVLAELRNIKATLAQQFGVTRLGIFGSLARDEAHDNSDIDVVLELKEPDLFLLVHIKEFLEDDFKRPVDLVNYREKMNPFLKKRIENEAVYV